jgi:hypothetical protein
MDAKNERKNKKPTWPVVWHVGFETENSKKLRFESTSGQMSAADSNSRLPRYNNRSGKSCA